MPQSKPIGFRLPPALARKLAAEAARRDLTPGTFARRVVLDALADDAGRVADELALLRADLARLRAELRRATVALLADAGKADIEEAEAWVRDNLAGA
jgi:glucokinase